MLNCDLCSKPVEAGQPRYGGTGSGDKSGARHGWYRHYDCHVAEYGRPAPIVPLRQLVAPRYSEPSGKVVLQPKVRKGPLNRSENAGRSFKLYDFISEMGRRRAQCDCPFCYTTFTVYVWSLSGGGKRCPNCKAMFGSFGVAQPIEGNEDLGTPA